MQKDVLDMRTSSAGVVKSVVEVQFRSNESARIAVIGDIHYGRLRDWKGIPRGLGNLAGQLISSFVEEINGMIYPDCVVQLGDMFSFLDLDSDIRNLKGSLDVLGKIRCPLYHVVGNHEQVHFSETGIRKLLDTESLYYSFNINQFHVIVLYAKVLEPPVSHAIIDEDQLIWLRKDLKENQLPTVVFVHYPLADFNLNGHVYFPNSEKKALVENREIVRHILEDSGQVLVVLSGHLHCNCLKVHNDIPYITLQSLVENFNEDGIPASSYGVLSLRSNSILFEVYGNDYARYEYSASNQIGRDRRF